MWESCSYITCASVAATLKKYWRFSDSKVTLLRGKNQDQELCMGSLLEVFSDASHSPQSLPRVLAVECCMRMTQSSSLRGVQSFVSLLPSCSIHGVSSFCVADCTLPTRSLFSWFESQCALTSQNISCTVSIQVTGSRLSFGQTRLLHGQQNLQMIVQLTHDLAEASQTHFLKLIHLMKHLEMKTYR